MSAEQRTTDSGDPTPFRGFAHPRGTGLSLSARGFRWVLTIEIPDGGGYPPFQELHQRPMTAADVRRFVGGLGLDWTRESGGSLRQGLVAMDSGFRLRLTPALDAPVDAAAMVDELEGLLRGSDRGPPERGRGAGPGGS